MNTLELAGFKPVREENTLIGSLMKPFALVKGLKALGLIMLAVLLVLLSPGNGSDKLKFGFLFFPAVQKALGIRIPATDLLDSTVNR